MDLQSIGPYVLHERLGEGGMGEVFHAHDTRLDRSVAIKRLRADAAADPRQLERFRREARAVARLSHPAIVQIYDLLSADDGDWIVMEYVEGRTLRSWLVAGPLPIHRAIPLAREIADALAEAHDKGVIHRDLKTENVLVTPDGHAKIVDFGIAKELVRRGAEASLTAGGAILGTFRAMSPEQARGGEVTPRSDLFSFGVLLYETLTGRPPFTAANSLQTLQRICNDPHPPVQEINPSVPESLCRLVDHLLQKVPYLRPESAREVALALDEIAYLADGEPTHDGRSTLVTAAAAAAPGTVVRTLLFTDLDPGTAALDRLGAAAASRAAARHDRLGRELLADFGGREIGGGEGRRWFFERPIDGLRCGLAYHRGLERMAQELGIELRARAAIHLGEVSLGGGPAGGLDGPGPAAVESGAELTGRRLLSLARGRQTLLSRGAFDLARAAAAHESMTGRELQWLAHGPYFFAGSEEPVGVFEVGELGFAPLAVPADSEIAQRMVATGEEAVLGWRPASGQPIPGRSGWTLERKLGEGGFGEVWLAAHEKLGEKRVFKFCFAADRLRALRREVALFRVLKESLGHRDDIARIVNWNFDRAPFSVESEYTAAGSLVDWAAERGGIAAVPLATRLELVAQVADALAAAHSVGVLHKDVKPANVLIAADGSGRPRAVLTDFGIGLLTDRALLEARGLTALGVTELLASAPEAATGGTRIYVAPELMEGRPPTIQADIYALGVMLYQLAAGNLARALAPGWERDVDDDLLREDVAWLVDGSPRRRPGSAAQVAERLRALDRRRERRRAEERARAAERRSRRRRKALATVAAVATVFLVVVSVLAVQATSARREADRRRQQAEGLIGFMLGDLRAKLDPIGRLDILDEVGDQALAYFDALPADELSDEELFRLSQALYQIGEVRMDQGEYESAAEVLRESLELAREAVRRDPDNTDRLVSLGESHFWIGSLFWRHDELDDARERFDAYRAIAEQLVARDPDRPEWRRELAYAHNNIGLVLKEQGRPEEALEPLRAALEIKEWLVRRDPEDPELRRGLATGHNSLASALEATGDLRGALSHYRTELGLWQRLVAGDPNNSGWQHGLAVGHQFVAQLQEDLGSPATATGHYRTSLRLAERLAELDPSNTSWQLLLAASQISLAKNLLTGGDPPGALAHLRSAQAVVEAPAVRDLRIRESLLRRSLCHSAIAGGLLASGDPGGALISVRSALAILEPLAHERPDDGELHRHLATSLILLGQLWTDLEQPVKAREAWERAVGVIEPFARGSQNRRLLACHVRALLHLDRLEEARPAIEKLRLQGYRETEYLRLCRQKGLAEEVSDRGDREWSQLRRAPGEGISVHSENRRKT